MASTVLERLAAVARKLSFGQDTSTLRARPDGVGKRWRAEVPATEEQKQLGKQRFEAFSAAYPMDNMQMPAVVAQHIQ